MSLTDNTINLQTLLTAVQELPDSITIDTTLTQPGQAADAKAVGDALEIPHFDLVALGMGTISVPTTATSNYAFITLNNETFESFVTAVNNGKISVTFKVNFKGAEYTHQVIPAISTMPGFTRIVLTGDAGRTGQTRFRYAITCDNSQDLYCFVEPFSAHQHDASDIKAGTFAGAVIAQTTSQAPETSLLRNSTILSTATNPTNNGEIVWQYE